MSSTMLALRTSSARTLLSASKCTHAPAFGIPLRRYESTDSADAAPRRGRAPRETIPRTHFLVMPFYEDAALRDKLAVFREALLNSTPKIETLEPGIVMPKLYQALEFRLGNLNIEGHEPVMWEKKRLLEGEEPEPTRPAVQLAQVVEALEGLQAPIHEILTANGGDGRLRVPLGSLRPLFVRGADTFNPRKANVLFLEPTLGAQSDVLRAVSELVHERFRSAGLWVDTPRSSKLSMTLINTRGRADKEPGKPRKGFRLDLLYASEAFRTVQKGEQPSLEVDKNQAEPRAVDFGVGEVQALYLMKIGASAGAGESAPVPDAMVKLS